MRVFLSAVFFFVFLSSVACSQEAQFEHVVLISIDGMRSDVVDILKGNKSGGFAWALKEGVYTLNARTDADYTITLPNHTSMITGVPVLGDGGHGVVDNGMLSKTVHEYAGHRVMSIFDVLKRHGRQGAMLASKSKFEVYTRSFPIDTVRITNYDDAQTVGNFERLVSKGLPAFVFMHWAGLDKVGHTKGWDMSVGSAYLNEAAKMDLYLKRVLKAVIGRASLAKRTAIIITADHGGEERGHGNSKRPLNYTIPFIIWGKAVAKGDDLYRINKDTRRDPLTAAVGMDEQFQPIRNGDAANLALALLGLPRIDGSLIGAEQSLKTNKD